MDWNNGFEEEEEKQEEDDLESDSSSMEDDSSDDDDSQDNDRAADGTFRLDPSVRDHVLYMDVDASYFGRQAEALTDPRHEDLLETVEELVLDPSLANGPSAQAVAEFLESIEWLRRLTFTRYFAPTSIVINLDQLGRYMDLWLAAATRNTQLHLTSFDYGLCAASLPVFRDFYRTKVTGIMLHLQAAPVHFMNLRHYLLDPDLGLDALAIHMDWNEGTPTLQELERWLPQTTTLEKLQIHFPRRLNPALDHSPIFLSPTVHALELVRGRIDHVPANATLRQLSLTETRLDGNASTPLASLTSLESLSLTKCHVEEGQSFSLQPVLAANIASLQSLTFKDNTFGTDDDAWWQELLPFLRKSLACRDQCRLGCLHLGPRGISGADHRALFEAVARSKLEHYNTNADILDDVTRYQAALALVKENGYIKFVSVSPLQNGMNVDMIRLFDQIAYYRQLNCLGRRFWNTTLLPRGLWPRILARLNVRQVACRCSHCGLQERLTTEPIQLWYAFMRGMPDLAQPPPTGRRRDGSDLDRPA